MRRASIAVVLVVVVALGARLALGGVRTDGTEAAAAQAQQMPGAVLPALHAVALDGAAVPPEAYRGRLLVLNVWAPWCAPCRREMPSLARLHARLDPARFRVVALAADEDRLAVAEFVTQRGLPFAAWTATDRAGVLASLAIDRIPTTLVVAPDGRVLARVVGPREWDAPSIVADLEAMAEDAGRAAGPASGNRSQTGVGDDG